MPKPRTYLLTAAAIAAALTLSACSGGTTDTGSSAAPSSPDSSASSVDFADADIEFAQMMIPHHEQAVEMSDDLLAKDGIDQRIVDLATEIKAAQEPEIKQLESWLTAWGIDDTSSSEMDMSEMDHGTDGMMSDDEMNALKSASSEDAGKLFLEQMTVHHEGAIAMAQTEIDEGQNPDAVDMATNIVDSQTAELDVMNDILATL
ncbi:DUF305 domain-containing protein [Cryobacterium adonitolivorans]|uniref:DUF305 domain-containing protein n=1 Tax=Cryobacterium adonitolivorans TaxID=1259189 RepID=A0A4R8W8N5_9MICO|nr:DUF305 domain-containing protein [Cryobacterium adonitolivorans]TFC03837.1 DUF305 domain-containing protein [Cryobacterium adonitolivorans]